MSNYSVPSSLAVSQAKEKNKVRRSFWIMVEKEMGDHIRSWRFAILVSLILLACLSSIYSAIQAIKSGELNDSTSYLFLSIFTLTDGTIPQFTQFVTFLGPLMGIALGFDAINAERNKGTLSRLVSQPIYRDDILKAKFTAALLLISIVMFALGFLVMGLGFIFIGYPPTPAEFLRVVFFLVTSIVYIGFWLSLAIFASIKFRQAATSALSTISVWIFFTVFYGVIINLLSGVLSPDQAQSSDSIMRYYNQMQFISRLSPAELFGDITNILLVPTIRSLGFLTMEQVNMAIESPLSISQSLLLVWPQLTALIALTFILFAVSFYVFLRQEIRSRM